MKSYKELRPLDPSWRKIYLPRLQAGEVISKKGLTPKEAKDLDYACSHLLIAGIHKAILEMYKDENMPALYKVEWAHGEPRTARELLWEASTTYYENFNRIESKALVTLAEDVVHNRAPHDVTAAFKTRYSRRHLLFFRQYYLDRNPSAQDLISTYPSLVLACLRVRFKDFDPDKEYSSTELSHYLQATQTEEFATFVLSIVALDDMMFGYLVKHGRREEPSEEVAFMDNGAPSEIFDRFEIADGVIQQTSDGYRINPNVLRYFRKKIEEDQLEVFPHRPPHRNVRRECPFLYVDFNRQFIRFLVNNMSKFVIEHKATLDSERDTTTV